MGRIKKNVKLKGLHDDVINVNALFDTGADFGGISSELINKITSFKYGRKLVKDFLHIPEERDIYTIGIEVDECITPMRTVIIDNIKDIDPEIDIIIGNEAMQDIGECYIDMENETVICKSKTVLV